MRAGYIHVPINFGLTGDELRYIVEKSGAQTVIADVAMESGLAALDNLAQITCCGQFEGGEGFDILKAAQTGDADVDRIWDVSDDDLVQILFTSGTTGLPKGGVMTHRALMAEYSSCIVEGEYSSDDVVLSALPLYHSGQMHTFTMPQLLTGAGATILQGAVPAALLEMIERYKVNSFFAPPTAWGSLLRHGDFDKRDLSTLRKVYYGASIMPVPIIQEMRQRLRDVRFYNCYGQSEVGPLATLLRPDEHDARPASAGRPVLNVETRIVDEDMNDVAPGVAGEIVHRSPQIITGYWDNPKSHRGSFQGRLVSFRRHGVFRRGGLSLYRRPHKGRYQYWRRPRGVARSRGCAFPA